MRRPQQEHRTYVLAGLAAASALIVVVVLAAVINIIEGSGAPGGDPREQSTAPTAAEPAALSRPVTRVPNDPVAPFTLVARAHTVVFAVDQPDTAVPGSALALHLRAPVVLVPAPDAGASERAPSETASRGMSARGMTPSETVSQPAGASSEASTSPADDIAAAARRRGVRRAIVVGDGAHAVAEGSGAREIVRVPPDAVTAPSADAVITAAAGNGRPADIRVDRRRLDEAGAEQLPAASATGAAVLTRPGAAAGLATVVTARAVGHTVVPTRTDDLRADPAAGERLAAVADSSEPPPLVLVGKAFGDVGDDALVHHAAVAMTGVTLPGGDQLVFDPRNPTGRRYVGLYGVTQSPELGALGEQPVAESVRRAKRLARAYQAEVGDDVQVLPCFEIIATIASASAGKDKNYSQEQPVERLREAVDAAEEAGVYVLLDLQPGRTDFLTQAKRYRSLLARPHVGLALDPEWRLRPKQKHLKQIGSVPIAEVNEVATWLADLVRRRRLPQKLLLLHQFRLSMLPDRHNLDTSRDELAYVIQMDGQGPQRAKLETWRAVTADPPDNVLFGWKNFYDEDQPTRSPAATMALDPPPVFVSYQ